MKTIGLIGGMSWVSSAEYYRLINALVKEKLGGLHSAKSVMLSVDFDELEALQRAEDWGEMARMMIDAAQRLETAGAGLIVICANTMHKVADDVQKAIGIPLVHIVDATGERIRAAGMTRVGLLGTRFTMEDNFYRDRLAEKYGLDVLIPDEDERRLIHAVIYEELCVADVRQESKERFVEIIGRLSSHRAEGVILGCTEIPLLIKEDDVDVPLFETTRIHAEAAVDYALAD